MADEPRTRTHYDPQESRVGRIFATAMGLDPEEREEYVERVCEGDRALEARVLERVHGEDGEKPPAGDADPAPGTLAPLALGTDRVGPYRLVRELGRGGMGVVYLGERDDGLVEQQVAIKALLMGWSGRLGERFDQERRILAGLEHPGIARLLDVGATEAGLPYLVMEKIDGQPIDRFCAEKRLSIRQRLQLFVEVCEAVEAAHRNLVIHRDLKPSNILVTPDGRPKLLDFGIAKWLEDEASADRHSTIRMLTPEWASPEQVLALPTTVQSDVYQLGLLLHVLATGTKPYDLDGLSPALQVLEICKKEIGRPSSVVRSRSRQERSALESEMGAGGDRIENLLVGDLDAILLRALQKEAKGRYESVEQLRRDVEAHLADRPVSARLPTLQYRAGRFLSRHRWAALVLASAFATILGIGLFAVREITAERDEARRQALRAEQRENEARAATEFLAGLLRKADPHRRGRAEELTVREALELGIEQLRTELADAPMVRARVLLELAEIFESLGETERTIALGNDALALFEQGGEAFEADSASSLRTVGRAYRVEAEFDRATAYQERALAIRRRIDRGPEPETARVLAELAVLADMNAMDLDLARRYSSEALRILDGTEAEAVVGQKALLLNNIGILHKNIGATRDDWDAFEIAESSFRRSLEEMERRPEMASRIPTTLLNLGNLQMEMGKTELAEQTLEKAHSGLETWLGSEHPRVAMAASNWGRTLIELGRFDEAEQVLGRALDLREAAYGPVHTSVAVVLDRLGFLHMSRGAPEKALPLFERALRIERGARAAGHQAIARALGSLGRCHAALGNGQQAFDLLGEGVRIYQEAGHEKDARELITEQVKLIR